MFGIPKLSLENSHAEFIPSVMLFLPSVSEKKICFINTKQSNLPYYLGEKKIPHFLQLDLWFYSILLTLAISEE